MRITLDRIRADGREGVVAHAEHPRDRVRAERSEQVADVAQAAERAAFDAAEVPPGQSVTDDEDRSEVEEDDGSETQRNRAADEAPDVSQPTGDGVKCDADQQCEDELAS